MIVISNDPCFCNISGVMSSETLHNLVFISLIVVMRMSDNWQDKRIMSFLLRTPTMTSLLWHPTQNDFLMQRNFLGCIDRSISFRED